MIEAKTITRSCGSCTKCCEGYLIGSAYGFQFKENQPCAFLSKQGCSIYPVRPAHPCKSFQCEWTINFKIPEWLQPNRSHVIMSMRTIGDYTFLMLVPAGQPISQQVHEWAEKYSKQDIKNHVLIVGDITCLLYTSPSPRD